MIRTVYFTMHALQVVEEYNKTKKEEYAEAALNFLFLAFMEAPEA